MVVLFLYATFEEEGTGRQTPISHASLHSYASSLIHGYRLHVRKHTFEGSNTDDDMAPDDKRIYSATYSNVPVYEYNVSGNHIMRRRSDDWINATHILKVADYDKPARTRILEREVQKGVHEKVQGGYGKYQGMQPFIISQL